MSGRRSIELPAEQLRGTYLGVPRRVDWSQYSRGEIERHVREVHYEVLRQEGISADRAAEIVRESVDGATGQRRTLDRLREEQERRTRGELRPSTDYVTPSTASDAATISTARPPFWALLPSSLRGD